MGMVMVSSKATKSKKLYIVSINNSLIQVSFELSKLSKSRLSNKIKYTSSTSFKTSMKSPSSSISEDSAISEH